MLQELGFAPRPTSMAASKPGVQSDCQHNQPANPNEHRGGPSLASPPSDGCSKRNTSRLRRRTAPWARSNTLRSQNRPTCEKSKAGRDSAMDLAPLVANLETPEAQPPSSKQADLAGYHVDAIGVARSESAQVAKAVAPRDARCPRVATWRASPWSHAEDRKRVYSRRRFVSPDDRGLGRPQSGRPHSRLRKYRGRHRDNVLATSDQGDDYACRQRQSS
jgi:hypothetical protein